MLSEFRKETIPLANSGSIGYLIEIPRSFSITGKKENQFNSILSFAMENEIKKFFLIPEDGNSFFQEMKESFSLSKTPNFELSENELANDFKDSNKEELFRYLFKLETRFKNNQSKNILFIFSETKLIEVKLYISSMILSFDESISSSELTTELFFGSENLKDIEASLQIIKDFMYSEYYLTQKNLIFLNKEKKNSEENLTNKPKSSLIEKASQYRSNSNSVELNLSSLNTKITESPLSKIDTMTFNLGSLKEEEFHPEEGSEDENLVDELMSFAESLELNKEFSEDKDDWGEAFPDTGLKVESNLSTNLEHLIEDGVDDEFEMHDLLKDDEHNFVKLPKEDNSDKTIYIEAIPEPNQKKEKETKKPKPPTIIVTAERIDTIRPITDEYNSIANKDFNAIHLD